MRLIAAGGLAAGLALPSASALAQRVISASSEIGGGSGPTQAAPQLALGSCTLADLRAGADRCQGHLGATEASTFSTYVAQAGASGLGGGSWTLLGRDTQVYPLNLSSTTAVFDARSTALVSANPAWQLGNSGSIVFGSVVQGDFVVALSGTYLALEADFGGIDQPVTRPWVSYYGLDNVLIRWCSDGSGCDLSRPGVLNFRLQQTSNQMQVQAVSVYQFVPTAPVPEPAGWALMAIGLGALAALRRRLEAASPPSRAAA